MMLFHYQNKIGLIYGSSRQLGAAVLGHDVAVLFQDQACGGFDGLVFYGTEACGAHDDVGGRKGDPQEVFGGRAAANIANADNHDSFKQGSFLCAKHAQPARALNYRHVRYFHSRKWAVSANKGYAHIMFDGSMACGRQQLPLF